TDDTTTNATMYPLWVTASSGNVPAKVSSTKLNYNPSTGTITATVGNSAGIVVRSANACFFDVGRTSNASWRLSTDFNTADTFELLGGTGGGAASTQLLAATTAGSFTLRGGLTLGSTAQVLPAYTTTGADFAILARSITDSTSSGTVAVNAVNAIGIPTLLASSATTYTDSSTLQLNGPPVASTNVTQTRAHTLSIVDSTSAASSITGGLVVAATLGTAATSVGIGGGNVIAGGNITAAGTASIGSSAQFVVNASGLPTKINNLSTAGEGAPIILGLTSQKAETGSADANVLTVTPAAAVGNYRVCTAISVASATSGVISWTLSWTDSNGNAQSNIAQQIFQMGTAAPNTTFTTSAAGNYYGCAMIDVNNGAANIVVKWVGGGTTSAKMTASVERLN